MRQFAIGGKETEFVDTTVIHVNGNGNIPLTKKLESVNDN